METTRRYGAIATLIGVCLGLQLTLASPCRAWEWPHHGKTIYSSKTVTVTRTTTRGVPPQVAPVATAQPVTVVYYQAPAAPAPYIQYLMPVAPVAVAYVQQPQASMPVAPYAPTYSAPAPVAPYVPTYSVPAPIAPMPMAYPPQAPAPVATPQR